MLKIEIAPNSFDDWDSLLQLVHRAFSFMEGQIVPPSSVHFLGKKRNQGKSIPHVISCSWIYRAAAFADRSSEARNFVLSDFNCPQAAMISRPLGTRTGDE